MFVDRKDIHEFETHKFVADCSDIGITAEFLYRNNGAPKSLETNAGNKMSFIFSGYEFRDGELVAAKYRQANGCINLILHND